jgi:FkbM family methyltransferase
MGAEHALFSLREDDLGMGNRVAWPTSYLIQSKSAGLNFIGLPNKDLIAQRLRDDGSFEPELLALAATFLSAAGPGIVIDVGANIGSFALPVAAAFPQQDVICFEAQRLVSYQLCGAVALNGFSNVEVRHAAVSDHAGVLEFAAPNYAVETNIGAMSLDSRINGIRGACTQGAVERVQMIRLDDLPISDLRLLKIDVEGMELAVLRGAEALLARNSYPPILCECWNAEWFEADRLALFAWFAQHGYQLQGLGDNFVATQIAR